MKICIKIKKTDKEIIIQADTFSVLENGNNLITELHKEPYIFINNPNDNDIETIKKLIIDNDMWDIYTMQNRGKVLAVFIPLKLCAFVMPESFN